MRKWTKEEIQYLKDHVGKVPDKEIAFTLSRTEKAVRHQKVRYNLKTKHIKKWSKYEDDILKSKTWFADIIGIEALIGLM